MIIRIVFLPGTHYVNKTKSKAWSDKSSTNMTIVGKNNVTIDCTYMLYFHFNYGGYITITNIHFKNCSSQSRTTLFFTVYDAKVSLINI